MKSRVRTIVLHPGVVEFLRDNGAVLQYSTSAGRCRGVNPITSSYSSETIEV